MLREALALTYETSPALKAGRAQLRATDEAGNTDATPATRRFAVPFDSTRLEQDTDRWKKRRGGRYYEGRFLRADKRGERLSYEVTDATKLVLLATKGPDHGKLRVFLDGTKIKNVNLQRSRGKSTQRITLARFDLPRSGRVEIKTLRNKQVKIEGLGVVDRSQS